MAACATDTPNGYSHIFLPLSPGLHLKPLLLYAPCQMLDRETPQRRDLSCFRVPL